MRGLLAMAGGISGYLLWLTLSGQAAAGCTADGGCGSVLASRWSTVLDWPITLPAIGLYALLLAASFQLHQVWARWVLAGGAAAILLAAGWFTAVQGFALQHWCPWCMAAHSAGSLAALYILLRYFRIVPVLGGVLAAAGLIALQWSIEPTVLPVQNVTVTQVRNLDPAALPHLGPTDAPVVVGYLYDVNCPACRNLHSQLQAARQRYGNKLVVALLPVVFHPDCNPQMTRALDAFATSCALQRLAVAVFIARPETFEAFDQYLFAQPQAPSPDAARKVAQQLIGDAALDAALADPAVDQLLLNHAQLFGVTGKAVPRLIIAERLYPPTADAASLFTLLEMLTPLESPSVVASAP